MIESGPRVDKVMVCRDCGKTFIFSVAGQEFFQEQGFREPPKRCRSCREKRKAERQTHEGGPNHEGKYPAICWNCQRPVMVPFKPAPNRPVFCRVCYNMQKRRGLV